MFYFITDFICKNVVTITVDVAVWQSEMYLSFQHISKTLYEKPYFILRF